MAALFDSGRIVELIVLGMLLEAFVLAAAGLRSGSRLPTGGLLLNLAAGGCLLLALRAVLVGAAWTTAAGWLSGALVAHIADVTLRIRAHARPVP
jgi:hypothetical protein